jgi:hypothetical protein
MPKKKPIISTWTIWKKRESDSKKEETSSTYPKPLINRWKKPERNGQSDGIQDAEKSYKYKLGQSWTNLPHTNGRSQSIGRTVHGHHPSPENAWATTRKVERKDRWSAQKQGYIRVTSGVAHQTSIVRQEVTIIGVGTIATTDTGGFYDKTLSFIFNTWEDALNYRFEETFEKPNGDTYRRYIPLLSKDTVRMAEENAKKWQLKKYLS